MEQLQPCLWNCAVLSEDFGSCSGVKPGCLLSPILIALFVNDITNNNIVGYVHNLFHFGNFYFYFYIEYINML